MPLFGLELTRATIEVLKVYLFLSWIDAWYNRGILRYTGTSFCLELRH